VNFLAKGNAPSGGQPYLAGAFLIGLGKKMVVSDRLQLATFSGDLLQNTWLL